MPSTVTIEWYIALSAILFSIGAMGVLLRRNAILLFMSVELMLNSANLLFVAFARHLGDLDGQVLVFFVITVAAAEVAVGLALIVAIFRTKRSINIDEINLLKSPGHHRNFLDCVKSRRETITPAEAAHRSASVGHVGMAALTVGRKLKFDPDTEQVIGDPAANAILGRAKRPPWHQ